MASGAFMVYGAYWCVCRSCSQLSQQWNIFLAQTNVAPNAFRTSTITPQYMTKFAMDQLCVQPGLNVSITVWQLPCD